MSTPLTCEQTSPGTATPIISGRNRLLIGTVSAGTMPAFRISWPW
jgi:hypothetical protein